MWIVYYLNFVYHDLSDQISVARDRYFDFGEVKKQLEVFLIHLFFLYLKLSNLTNYFE